MSKLVAFCSGRFDVFVRRPFIAVTVHDKACQQHRGRRKEEGDVMLILYDRDAGDADLARRAYLHQTNYY
jgi:hypothetical protein